MTDRGHTHVAMRGHHRGERGSSLILAMIFLVISSTAVLALSSAAANDLRDVRAFSSARTYHTALSSAMDVALYEVRYTPSTCTTSHAVPYSSADNLLHLNVWCDTPAATVNPLSTASRVVDLYACASTILNEATCALSPDLTAVATFDDYAPGPQPPMTTPCTANCGSGMILSDWKFR